MISVTLTPKVDVAIRVAPDEDTTTSLTPPEGSANPDLRSANRAAIRTSPDTRRPVVDITGVLPSKRSRTGRRVCLIVPTIHDSSWLWMFLGNPEYQVVGIFVDRGPLSWSPLLLTIPIAPVATAILPLGLDVLVDERRVRQTLLTSAPVIITAHPDH